MNEKLDTPNKRRAWAKQRIAQVLDLGIEEVNQDTKIGSGTAAHKIGMGIALPLKQVLTISAQHTVKQILDQIT